MVNLDFLKRPQLKEPADLPPHELKINARARRVSLKITSEGVLQLVLPHKRHHKEGLQFLKSRLDWIEKHRATGHLIDPALVETPVLPEVIHLKALEESWNIHYVHSNRFGVRRLNSETLRVAGDLEDFEGIQRAMLKWLRLHALKTLAPKLELIAENYGFKHSGFRFKHQKSIWGSCSQRHEISLNAKLLFFPFEWTRYVLIHELCHTHHFNHSPAFWDLVSRFEPEYKRIKTELKSANKLLPTWIRKS